MQQGLDIIRDARTLELAARCLRGRDPRFATLHALTGPPPLRLRTDGFEGLAEIITSQLISTRAAQQIWARLQPVMASLGVAGMAEARVEEIAAAGLTKAKARAIINAAKMASTGEFSFAQLRRLPDQDACAQLMQLTGVGQWSADIYLLTCLGRQDAWPAGDLALRKGIMRLERLDRQPDTKQMCVLAETWRPYRAVAARYIWAGYTVWDGRADQCTPAN